MIIKKFISAFNFFTHFLLTCCLLIHLPCFANCNYENMCPNSQDVNGKISATLSKITGMNALISNTLESQVKKQIDKALNGDFRVEIIPFGAKSMLSGKFKKLTFYSESANLDGLSLSNISAESVCEYNHFVYKNGAVYTNENFILKFSAEVTNDDLKEIVSSSEYQKLIKSLNVGVGNFSFLKVYDPIAQVIDDKVNFSVKVLSPLTYYEEKIISTSMGLMVEDSQLMFTEITTTPQLKTNLSSLIPLINKINPFIMNAAIMNNPDSQIKIQNINIENNKIFVKGLVIVPKNYYNN